MPAPAAAAAVGAAAGTLLTATGGLASAFTDLSKTIAPFVEALNPAAVQVFSLAMRDFSAVIGQALLPVFSELTRVVREAASELLPVTGELAPLFGRMAQAIGALAGPLVRLISDAIVPLTSFMTKLVEATASWWRALLAVGAGLTAVFESLGLGSFLSSAGDLILKATREMARVILVGTAVIAAAFGHMAVVTRMIAALTPSRRPSAEGFAAPVNPQFLGFSELGRQLALKSSVAGVAGGRKAEEEWLREIVEELKRITSGHTTLKSLIYDAITAAWFEAGGIESRARNYVEDRTRFRPRVIAG